MADRSAIEWTDASWNPIRAINLRNGKIGWHCEHATTGCIKCYSEGFNIRLGTGLPFKPGHRKDVAIFLDNKMLTVPLGWKKPRMIFVCSMTDAFADFVKDEWLDQMFAVMALCPQHTFQVLTKRAERMRIYIEGVIEDKTFGFNRFGIAGLATGLCGPAGPLPAWPLPNVWLGVSCERQEEADERIPNLLQTPATVRFVSAEPLVGPIDFTRIGLNSGCHADSLAGGVIARGTLVEDWPGLDWIIVGGESGNAARRLNLEWVRSVVAQCRAAGVYCFVKQLGQRPCIQRTEGPNGWSETFTSFKHSKGGDPAEWPEDLRVREFPRAA